MNKITASDFGFLHLFLYHLCVSPGPTESVFSDVDAPLLFQHVTYTKDLCLYWCVHVYQLEEFLRKFHCRCLLVKQQTQL